MTTIAQKTAGAAAFAADEAALSVSAPRTIGGQDAGFLREVDAAFRPQPQPFELLAFAGGPTSEALPSPYYAKVDFGAVRKHLAAKGFDPLMGARPMQRLIQDTIRKALADELLFGGLVRGGRLTVDWDAAAKDGAGDVLLDIQSAEETSPEGQTPSPAATATD